MATKPNLRLSETSEASIIDQLRAPFPPSAISFRAGSITKDKSRVMPLAYLTARDIMDRLDNVVPGQWSFELTVANGGEDPVIIGRLSIGSQTFSDIGTSSRTEPWKGAASDALKRCAVQAGIGRYLYDCPPIWVDYTGDGWKPFELSREELADLFFNEDGTIKTQVEAPKPKPKPRPKPQPEAPIEEPPPHQAEDEPAEELDGEELFGRDDDPENQIPKPKAKGKAKPAAKKDTGRPTTGTTDWEALAKFISEWGESEGFDFDDPTSVKSMTAEIAASIENERPATAAQLSFVFGLCQREGIEVPDNLLEMSVAEASKFIKQFTGQ